MLKWIGFDSFGYGGGGVLSELPTAENWVTCLRKTTEGMGRA